MEQTYQSSPVGGFKAEKRVLVPSPASTIFDFDQQQSISSLQCKIGPNMVDVRRGVGTASSDDFL